MTLTLTLTPTLTLMPVLSPGPQCRVSCGARGLFVTPNRLILERLEDHYFGLQPARMPPTPKGQLVLDEIARLGGEGARAEH